MREKNRQFRSHPLAKAAGVDLLVYCTDVARVPDPAEVMQKLPRGSIVICRDYAHPDREAYARDLRAITHKNGHFLLVAGDVALARRVAADGVHLPEYMLGARHVLGGFRLVSAACHNRLAMRRAERLGVDFILVSPAFSTRSHADARPLGPHRYARLSHCTHLAHIALGGVNSHSARKLRGLGLAGVAAIDGLSDL